MSAQLPLSRTQGKRPAGPQTRQWRRSIWWRQQAPL